MLPSRIRAGWKSCCLGFLLSLGQSAIFAQPQQRPAPQTLPELLTAIQDVMDRQQIPGLMLSIVSKDSVIFSGGLGYADLATQRKVDGRQKFRLGSTTKMMVAMGILRLAYRDKISLDTRVADIAPEISIHNPWEETHPLKIIHLLEHTSGFRDAFINKTVNLTGVDKQGIDVLKFYQRQLVCRMKPGTMPAYNNLNYTVLGYLIEVLTGQPWAEYIDKNVLLPIGMRNTDFKLHLPDNGEYAQGYLTRGGEQTPVPSMFSLNSNGAHGSMNSCADDMSKLISFFLNNWKIDTLQWLPESWLDDMEMVHTTTAAKRGLKNGYGLGNHIETWHPKATFHGHGGSIQGFLAHMIYDRKRGIGMAIAKNGGYDDAEIAMLIMDFMTRHLPDIEAKEQRLPLDSIQPFLGYYRPLNVADRYGFLQNLMTDVLLKVENNQLLVKSWRGRQLPLTHTGQMKFRRSFEHDELYTLGTDDKGNKIYMAAAPQGGTHFMQISFVSVLFKRSVALLSVLILLLSFAVGVHSIISLLLRNAPVKQLPLRIIPMLAGLSLFWGLWPLLHFESNYLSFTEPNTVTITIFLGMLFFLILSMLGLSFLYARWSSLTTRGSRILLTVTSVGPAIVALVFLYHGMMAPIWKW